MPPANRPQIASLIRGLRYQLHLSQEQFAARLGVSFKTVNRWENERVTPSPIAFKLIQDLLQQVEAASESATSKQQAEAE
jgi:DNA-binding transcriptional regulator YiaG